MLLFSLLVSCIEDFHPVSSLPCRAHTSRHSATRWLSRFLFADAAHRMTDLDRWKKMKSVFWLIRDSIGGRHGPQLEPWSVMELRRCWLRCGDQFIGASVRHRSFEAVGIETNWVPIPTDVPPTKESKERCVEALPRAFAFVSAQMSKGRRVLVHYHAGKDRTGMLLTVLVAKRAGLPARAASSRS